jgi:CRISP-associated protein Cas1
MSSIEDVPAYVPARMVNEFAYCPRLFYLEWVQAQFQDNVDTVHGRYVHRAVDTERGRALGPDEPDPFRDARSVTVSSERFGLIAKADIIEGDGGKVRPVEVKRGRPPVHGPAWEPELLQLCVIGIILAENGYQCDAGEFFYAETRERVVVDFDEALVARTLSVAAELREVAARREIPPPLIDSPKCPRCSLVGICLPDETNALTARSQRPVRRLTPRDGAARPVYVTEQGAYVGVSGGRLTVSQRKAEVAAVRLIDVSQLSVFGNVQVSTQLLRRLFSEEIPVCWFSYGGWFSGIAEGLPSRHVELRRRQVAIAEQAGLPIARAVIHGKIKNARTLLRRNARGDVSATVLQLKGLADQALRADRLESLLGVEGTAARVYFGQFSRMLKGDAGGGFDFTGRNRRPPRDPVNCLLSFAYSLLTKDLTATLIGIGFDPYLGFFHRPRFGRPALALDLAEEFRALIADSVVVQVINNGEVKESDFIVRAAGVALTGDGRKKVIEAYERRLETEVRHPIFGYTITYRRVLETQARLLGAHLLGEVPEYKAMVTR